MSEIETVDCPSCGNAYRLEGLSAHLERELGGSLRCGATEIAHPDSASVVIRCKLPLSHDGDHFTVVYGLRLNVAEGTHSWPGTAEDKISKRLPDCASCGHTVHSARCRVQHPGPHVALVDCGCLDLTPQQDINAMLKGSDDPFEIPEQDKPTWAPAEEVAQFRFACPQCTDQRNTMGALARHIDHAHTGEKRQCPAADARRYAGESTLCYLAEGHDGKHFRFLRECGTNTLESVRYWTAAIGGDREHNGRDVPDSDTETWDPEAADLRLNTLRLKNLELAEKLAKATEALEAQGARDEWLGTTGPALFYAGSGGTVFRVDLENALTHPVDVSDVQHRERLLLRALLTHTLAMLDGEDVS